MKRERNVRHDDRATKSLKLRSGLYESIHHPLVGEPSDLDLQVPVEIHARDGYAIDIVREEAGSLWIRIRRRVI